MVRASRIAGEVALYACMATLWPDLPRTIAVSLAIVAFVGVCLQIAFRLHDTNMVRPDVSLRD